MNDSHHVDEAVSCGRMPPDRSFRKPDAVFRRRSSAPWSPSSHVSAVLRDISCVCCLCVVDLGPCGYPIALCGASDQRCPGYEWREMAAATRGKGFARTQLTRMGVCRTPNPLHIDAIPRNRTVRGRLRRRRRRRLPRCRRRTTPNTPGHPTDQHAPPNSRSRAAHQSSRRPYTSRAEAASHADNDDGSMLHRSSAISVA